MSLLGGLLAGAAQGVSDSWTNRRLELKEEAANAFKQAAIDQRQNEYDQTRADKLASAQAEASKITWTDLTGSDGVKMAVPVYGNGQVAYEVPIMSRPSKSFTEAQKEAQKEFEEITVNMFWDSAEADEIEANEEAWKNNRTKEILFQSTRGSKFGASINDDAIQAMMKLAADQVEGSKDSPGDNDASTDSQRVVTSTDGGVNRDGIYSKRYDKILSEEEKPFRDPRDYTDPSKLFGFIQPEKREKKSLLESARQEESGSATGRSATERSVTQDTMTPEVTTTPEYYQDVRDQITAPIFGDSSPPSLLESATEQSMAEDTTTPLDAVKATEKTSNYDDNGDHVVSQFVIGQEGFKPNASEDSKGVSIGYGTNNKNVKLGQTITEKEAYRLMQKDLKSTQGYVDQLVNVPLTTNQNAAIVSLMYRTGYGNFEKSQALLALNAGDYEMFAELAFGEDGFVNTIIDEKMQRSQGLVNRSKQERLLFNGNNMSPRPTPSNIPPNSPKEFEAAYFNL